MNPENTLQWIKGNLLKWEAILPDLPALIIAINVKLSPYFPDLKNLLDTSFNFREKAVTALPMMIIIITGDIDIPVASANGKTSII